MSEGLPDGWTWVSKRRETMNALTTKGTTPFEMSMTSRQIAETTEKDHKHVKRDIKILIDN